MERNYLLGFNEGYLISRELPKLAQELSTISSPLPRIIGFKDGHRQYVLEKVRDMQPAWMQPHNPEHVPSEHEKDRDVGLER